MQQKPRITELLVIGLFIATIGIPCVFAISDGVSEAASSAERGLIETVNRAVLNARKGVADPQFGAQVAATPCNSLLVNRLQHSPHRDLFIGDAGWMFLLKPKVELSYFRQANPFSEEELEAWELMLRRRRDWCEERGMRYVVVIVPNKSSIHSDQLPDRITVSGTQSRFDQLLHHLPKELSDLILDLRPALFDGAKAEDVFLKRDNSWNDLGAYFGYRAILAHLKKHRPGEWAIPIHVLRVEDEVSGEGEIAQALMSSSICEEARPRYQVLDPRSSELTARATQSMTKQQFATSNRPEERVFEIPVPLRDEPTAVMFHDSFGEPLIPYLAEHFKQITFRNRSKDLENDEAVDVFDTSYIGSKRPDFVIDEFIERQLALPPPSE